MDLRTRKVLPEKIPLPPLLQVRIHSRNQLQ